jgi:acetoin utilization protein AcuB
MALSWVIQEATHPYPIPPTYPSWRQIEPVPRLSQTGAIRMGMQTPVQTQQGRAARRAYQEAEEELRPRRRTLFALDFMTTPVITLGADRTTADAREILERHRFGHLPIVDDDGRLVGILSDRDLTRGSETASGPVDEVMTRKVLTGTPGTEMGAIARVIVQERIHCMPIIDLLRRPVGILTTADILRAFVNEVPLDLSI